MSTPLPVWSFTCRADQPYTAEAWKAIEQGFEGFLHTQEGRELLAGFCRVAAENAAETVWPWEKLFEDERNPLIRVETTKQSGDGMAAEMTMRWADRLALRNFLDPVIAQNLRNIESRSLAIRGGAWTLGLLGLREEAQQGLDDVRQECVHEDRQKLEPLVVRMVLGYGSQMLIRLGEHLDLEVEGVDLLANAPGDSRQDIEKPARKMRA